VHRDHLAAAVTTTTTAKARSKSTPRSVINDRLLKAADAPDRPLPAVVKANLQHLWETGGRRGATTPGRQPDWIYIQPEFLVQLADDTLGPVLPRLVHSRGLQLRLEMLMIFDAQCRHELGQTVRNVRTIAPRADERWFRELTEKAIRAAVSSRRCPT
jgi:hypothetical protein